MPTRVAQPVGLLDASCEAVELHARIGARRPGWDVFGPVRYQRMIVVAAVPAETSCEGGFTPQRSRRGSACAARTAPRIATGPTMEAQQTSGERRAACDRRDQAGQADSDAPLTALCPVPMLHFEFFNSDFREELLPPAS